jgi:hypothetical protein
MNATKPSLVGKTDEELRERLNWLRDATAAIRRGWWGNKDDLGELELERVQIHNELVLRASHEFFQGN